MNNNETNSVAAIAADVATGRRSAEFTVRESLDRIAALDPGVGAFLSVHADMAIDRARALDRRAANERAALPLAGVPIALKDNIAAADRPTTCGSKILRDFRSGYSAHVVERLESAGAIVVGKTNLDEFAMGSSTENSGFHVTRNPWDRTRVAGGSSGGSACAVALSMVPAALGSDTGGSVRQPAAFCGVTGLKPTYGRVSRYGLVAYGSSLDQIGPIARSAKDVALLLSVITGHDSRDSTCLPNAVPNYLASLDRPLTGLRLGVSPEYFGEGLNGEVRAALESAITQLKSLGATSVEVHLPHLRYAIACYYLIAMAEASSNLARFDGVRYGHRTNAPRDVYDMYAASRGQGLGTEVKRRVMLGAYALSAGYYDAYYLKALRVRTLIQRDFANAFRDADLIVSPVAPTTAFTIGEKTNDPLAMYLEDIYTISANLAGICAISIPCGQDGRGLPIGLQIMGPVLSEDRVLNAAHQYQLATDHHLAAPPAATGAVSA